MAFDRPSRPPRFTHDPRIIAVVVDAHVIASFDVCFGFSILRRARKCDGFRVWSALCAHRPNAPASHSTVATVVIFLCSLHCFILQSTLQLNGSSLWRCISMVHHSHTYQRLPLRPFASPSSAWYLLQQFHVMRSRRAAAGSENCLHLPVAHAVIA